MLLGLETIILKQPEGMGKLHDGKLRLGLGTLAGDVKWWEESHDCEISKVNEVREGA